MTYILSDIHNDAPRLKELLRAIAFSDTDRLYILGDLFDRCDYAPDPVGVYFTILGLGGRCTVLRGNHDEWLARYILQYYATPERKRKRLAPYPYNSFELLRERLVPVDLLALADWIMDKPETLRVSVNGASYLFAHQPEQICEEFAIDKQMFFERGIDGTVCLFGHEGTANHRIWKNERGNVCNMDCGCGFKSGSLGCLCLESGEEFYI